jgi:hypothetical protein
VDIHPRAGLRGPGSLYRSLRISSSSNCFDCILESLCLSPLPVIPLHRRPTASCFLTHAYTRCYAGLSTTYSVASHSGHRFVSHAAHLLHKANLHNATALMIGIGTSGKRSSAQPTQSSQVSSKTTLCKNPRHQGSTPLSLPMPFSPTYWVASKNPYGHLICSSTRFSSICYMVQPCLIKLISHLCTI